MKKKDLRIAGAAAILAAALIFAGCEAAPNDGSGGGKDNAIHLVEGSFKDGDVAKNSEQWFSFTVTSAGMYYVHVIFGAVEYLNLRVFNRNGSPIGGEAKLWEHGSNWYFYRELPELGTYRIAYNRSAAAPL
jgi:hypothetical protein